jgi:phosphonate transport system permease protein
VAGQTALDEAPRLTTRWRSLGFSLRTIGLIVIVVLIYAYGWRATKIDVYQLVTGLPNMRHILAGLLQPDLFVQGTQTITMETPLRVGAGPKGPSSSEEAGARITVTPGSVQPGEEIVFEGSGFPANADGRLLLGHLTARSRLITQIKTDSAGNFREAFAWPQFAEDDYVVQVEIQSALNRWAPSEALRLTLEKIVETVLLALMGTSIGVLISVPLSFLGAKNLMRGSTLGLAIYHLVRTIFNITRSIEVLIVAVIMAVVVGIGPFAGVLALVVHSIGAMGKLYSEAIESIDSGPMEAITATGATRLQVVRYAVIPQVVPQFVSFTMYRWDINVRMSTVIGLVGGGGIGFLLIQYINLLQWPQAGTALWLIAAVVMIMDYASAEIRERIV